MSAIRPRPRSTRPACAAPLRTAAVPALALLSGLLLGACAAGEDNTAPGTTGATASGPASPTTTAIPSTGSPTVPPSPDGATRVAVTVSDGTVRPAPRRVRLDTGDRVVLRITADVTDEVHVHGVDKARQVAPDQPAVIRFVVDQPGLFEVELEREGLQLLQLEVR